MKYFLILILALPPAAQAQGPKGEESRLISKVSGMVGETIVTSRDVKISHMVEQAFKRQSFDGIDESSPKFSVVVSETLLEWMVFLESQALKAEDLTANEK